MEIAERELSQEVAGSFATEVHEDLLAFIPWMGFQETLDQGGDP